MTPNLIAGAWVGANDRRIHFQNLSDGQGARTALPIWGSFFTKLMHDPKFRNRIDASFTPSPVFAAYEINCVPYSEASADEMNAHYEEGFDVGDEIEALFNKDQPRKRRPRRKVRKESKGLKGLLESIFGRKDPSKTRKNRKKNK